MTRPPCGRSRAKRLYVFSEEGISFVPDGTRFALAQSPSDESLGYFRASLRDLGSRCILIRSNRWGAGIDFLLNHGRHGFHGRTRIPKSHQGRPTIAHGFNRGLWMQRRQEPRRGERKRRTWRPTKISAGARGLSPARRAKALLWRRCRAVGAVRPLHRPRKRRNPFARAAATQNTYKRRVWGPRV